MWRAISAPCYVRAILMPTLQIIIASTRPGRVGLPVARWFESRARTHGGLDVEVVDLAEIDLPFVDEPNHPRLRQYTQQHTKDWSAKVDAADAFVFVMPEYNYGFNAPLKNAIDYLHQEWLYKPVGLVSYGGADDQAGCDDTEDDAAERGGVDSVCRQVHRRRRSGSSKRDDGELS
jgi:hypothetical protein